VRRILETSCFDCHSSETNLRWYDRIVPAYWLVVDDVQRATLGTPPTVRPAPNGLPFPAD